MKLICMLAGLISGFGCLFRRRRKARFAALDDDFLFLVDQDGEHAVVVVSDIDPELGIGAAGERFEFLAAGRWLGPFHKVYTVETENDRRQRRAP